NAGHTHGSGKAYRVEQVLNVFLIIFDHELEPVVEQCRVDTDDATDVFLPTGVRIANVPLAESQLSPRVAAVDRVLRCTFVASYLRVRVVGADVKLVADDPVSSADSEVIHPGNTAHERFFCHTPCHATRRESAPPVVAD